MTQNKKFISFSLVIIALIVLGIVSFYLFFQNNQPETPSVNTPTNTNQAPTSPTPSLPPKAPNPSQQPNSSDNSQVIKACPEHWYVNKMPSVGDSPLPREYFIYQDKRRELSEFDLTWIKANCSIKPEDIY